VARGYKDGATSAAARSILILNQKTDEGTHPMSKPKLYGISGSRALRAIWGIEETGIDYEHVAVTYGADSKAAEYLEVNPNGRIPALVDGDVRLFESMAINLYLTRKYAPALYPANAEDEARAWQWSVWAISEIEPLQMQIVYERLFKPADKRDQKIIDAASASLQRPLKVLDGALDGQDYLLGDAFSVADLNVAAVMQLMKMIRFSYAEHANVQRWADACYARPALARAQARP
jgi:glutathione S-transferase